MFTFRLSGGFGIQVGRPVADTKDRHPKTEVDMNMIVSAATTPRPTVSVAEAKAKVTREIDARLKRLTDLEKSVASNTNLSTKTKDKLEAQLHKDTQGLNHLKETVDHATTASEVRTDRKAMIDDYRVFKMMAPKVAMLEKLAADRTKIEKLEHASNSEGPTGVSTNDLKSVDAALEHATKGLLDLTPKGYSSQAITKYRDVIKLAEQQIASATKHATAV